MQGPITGKMLANVWNEIVFYKNREEKDITVVINSDGGNGTKTLEFVDKIKRVGDVNISAKIYHAESAAALIAFAFSEREIVKDGQLVIHLGSVEVESCDIDEGGTISKGCQVVAKKFKDEVLKAAALPPGPYVDKLLATNRLTLTADECLKLGIVGRIIG